METSSFQVGDDVRLRSGGPVLTVVGRADGDGVVELLCEWVVDRKLQREWFQPVTLELASEPERFPWPSNR